MNLFENLDIEEPSDAFLNYEPDSSGQEPTFDSQIKYGVDRISDHEEVYFAVDCLFNDYDNIRRYVQQIWKDYKHGIFDLVAASITTNTAIDFARRLQEDFIETFPTHTDFEELINVMYAHICAANDHIPELKERPDDEMNFAVYDDAEPILVPTYMLVSAFKDILQPGILPMYQPGYYGVYDALSERETKSARDKFREDKIVLLKVLPDFYVFSLRDGSMPAEDEMTRGVREMAKQSKVPIWLVFGAQVFLDIHHTLRDQVDRGFEDLIKSATHVKNNIQEILKFHENLRIENWPKSNDQVLFQIVNLVKDWVETDAVEAARKSLVENLPPGEPFMFLKNHPLYCGLLAYKIKILAQEASIVFVNAWGSVLYSAHLYNALRQERLIINAWPDMDSALLIHRTEDMFIGDFPKTTEDYFKRFCLTIGHSASMFAKNRRRSGVVASKAGPRALNGISPVSMMFKSRYCDNDGRTNLSLDDIEVILKKYVDDSEDVDSEVSSEWATPKIKIKLPGEVPLAPHSNGTQSSESRKRRSKTRRSAASGVRPLHLLNALLEAMQSEMLELTFDHFRLHMFSWRLLREIKQRLDADLHDIYGPMYLEKETELPYIVGYIFMTAVQTSKRTGMLVPKLKDVVTSRLFVKAAEVVKEMLVSGAGEIGRMMLKNQYGMEVETPDLLGLEEPRNASNGGALEA